MLVSAIQRSESAVCTHTCPPSWTSLPPPSHPPPLGHHRALSWAPCSTVGSLTHGSAHTSIPTFQSTPISMTTYLFYMSVTLFLPANRFKGTIFLDYTYMCYSFWVTLLCMTDSRSIHVSTNDPVLLLFLSLSNNPFCICITSSLSIHLWWTLRLLLYFGNCK